MEIYWPMKSRVSTSVSAQSVLPWWRAMMSTNFLSGLLGPVKGAGFTGTGAQAASGVALWAGMNGEKKTRDAVANPAKCFFVPIAPSFFIFWWAAYAQESPHTTNNRGG